MVATRKVTKTVATKEPYLKGKNAVYLWSFIGVNLAIFLSLVVSRQFASSSIDHFWQRVTTKDGIIAASIPLLAIVLSGVLSDTGKARLVFWRWRNPLPGCRAFTELVNTDPRIDVSALRTKYGDFPQDLGSRMPFGTDCIKLIRPSRRFGRLTRPACLRGI
jgi:hypothetical protein